jgi:DNA-binding NtrC family response regulator
MRPLAGRRILIAEDEILIALQLEAILQELGCQIVGPVTRVEDVRACVEARSFDGALVDVNLRGEQVFGVLPDLIELGVPFVITSGYADATLFPPPFRAVPRIAKPFDEAALRRLCLAIFAKG